MSYDKEFERIFEKANYAKVEDRINDLARSLEGDSTDIGYGIARNALANSGNTNELYRLEDMIDNVSDELEDVSKGISQYASDARRTSTYYNDKSKVNYRDYSKYDSYQSQNRNNPYSKLSTSKIVN